MRAWRTFPLLLGSLVLISGCAGSGPPELSRYLLRSEVPFAERPLMDTPRVIIGRVLVAPYLNQLGIVVETAPGQVRAARYHLWAEPLDQGLRQYLRQTLSREMAVDVGLDSAAGWDYRLDVRFEEFHGSQDGRVDLTADYSWTLAAGDAVTDTIQRRMFTGSEPLTDDGYTAMVAAHKRLLDRLVATVVRELPQSSDRAAAATRR